MVDHNKVPAKAIQEDHRLESAATKASEALAQHRWHWTLDESNPDRVGFSAYARAVGRGESTIRMQARAWETHRNSRAGARTFGETLERSHYSAESEAVTEAVAEANEVSFKQARTAYAPDVSRVREATEKAAERKPDMTAEDRADYAKRTAQTIARSKAADAKRRAERTNQRSVMFMRIDAKLAHARRDLKDVLDFGRDLGLGDEEVEDIKGALAKIKSFADLIDLALTGSMDVDWDAELAKIGGDS